MSDRVYFTPFETEMAIRKLERSRGIGREIALECAKLEEGNTSSEERIEELENQVERYEGECDELQEWKVNAKDEIQDLKDDNENSGEKIRELEERVKELEQEIEALKADLHEIT